MQASVNLISVGPLTFPPTIDVLWRPDGQGNVETWDQVMTTLNGLKKPVTVWIGPDSAGPYIIPPGSYEMHESSFQSITIGDSPTVVMSDGVTLHNLQRVSGVRLECHPSADYCFHFHETPGQPTVVFIQLGGSIVNAGTFPAMHCTSSQFIIFGLDFQAEGFAGSVGPIVELDAGTLTGAFVNFASGSLSLPDNMILGGPLSTFLLAHDGTLPAAGPFFPIGFTGQLINSPAGVAGGSGTTAFRPQAGLGPIPIGCCYFDTTIVPPRPIFWDGVQWVDAMGIGPV